MTDPTIPFGYKQITGQSQRGDGIWDGTRFAKVKKEYPHSEGRPGFNFIIRKCAVVQPELPGTSEPTITVHNGHIPSVATQLTRSQYEDLKKSGMMWEFYPDALMNWPEGGQAEQGMCLDE